MDRFIQKNRVPRTLSALLLTLILTSTLLPSCNDNTITQPNTPEGSPSVSESSSPSPTEETPTPTPSDNYTDLPVVDCDHEKVEFIREGFPVTTVAKGFSKENLSTVIFSEEVGEIIAPILNTGNWVQGELDVEGDWYLYVYQGENAFRLQYSKEGIFFRYDYNDPHYIHLVLTDRQRDVVTSILENRQKTPSFFLDPADPQTVYDYLKERGDHRSLKASSRTDFVDPDVTAGITLDTPYENVSETIGSAHFIYGTAIDGCRTYPCYTEFFVLSDGQILELKIETDQNEFGQITSRTIIGKRLLTITEFEKEYLTRFTEETDENVVRLRKGLPLLFSLHTLADTPFANDQLGYTADFSRNDALDPSAVELITEGLSSYRVYDLLGSPHVSHREHSNMINSARAFYALSDGKILEVTYKRDLDITEDEKNALCTEYALSDKAVFYTVSHVTVHNEAYFLDFYLYVMELYCWYVRQW